MGCEGSAVQICPSRPINKIASKMEIAVTVKGETAANSGIAMIVPADEVKKLIENNPVVKGYRDAYLSNLKKNLSPATPPTP